MKNTLTLIIFILLSKTIAAQQIDSLVFQKISKQLVDRYLADYSSFNVSRNTASRDLSKLVEKGIFKASELKGAGSYYEL